MQLINLHNTRRMLKPGSVVTLMCWDRAGRICRYDKVIVTSKHYKPDYIHVMHQTSSEVRRIRTKLIFMINDFELCL